MTQFRFRLEKVLRVREAERMQRRQELAQATQAEQILVGQIEQLTGGLDDTRQLTRAAIAPGPIDVDKILDAQRYLLVLSIERREVEERLKEVRAELQRRRRLLIEADQRVRMLEKLRDNKREEVLVADQRREQGRLDEISHRRPEEFGPS